MTSHTMCKHLFLLPMRVLYMCTMPVAAGLHWTTSTVAWHFVLTLATSDAHVCTMARQPLQGRRPVTSILTSNAAGLLQCYDTAGPAYAMV
ncbi:hypothetical protein COO60DRAFT_1503958 [Scenedesmus sp. NREL 46B-D3]|nr:hypothetical protein COO60DRAFT_1503958 [Scenedesmus sp. NREL 46B-D3]